MTVRVHHGDSREVLKTLADCSVDACVTDPPYALVATLKRFANSPRSEATEGSAAGPYQRTGRGFMGQKWDTGDTAHDPDFWREVYRVLKPGAHVVAFAGTRTYHRLACAVEDGGFEIRDMVAWLYGSGFPKSHDVSKGIDKALGAAGETLARGDLVKRMIPGADQHKKGWEKADGRAYQPGDYAPGTKQAEDWEGWGTALKPALEPIVLARKPLDGTVAGNVLTHGCGALNIGACRVAGTGNKTFDRTPGDRPRDQYRTGTVEAGSGRETDRGRWPANVCHDGSDETLTAFPVAPGQQRPVTGDERALRTNNAYGDFGRSDGGFEPRGDSGSAARFFYRAEKDNLCDLCGMPCMVTACAANNAETSSPTSNIPPADIAASAAAASLPLGSAGSSKASRGHAPGAESPSSRRRRTISDIADEAAPTPPPPSLVQNVKSAANLCGSCATAIAQSLAASRQGRDPASLAFPASISERSGQILRRHLALYVEGRESTDTILTTPGLKTLLGSVFHAIGASTPESAVEPSGSNERSRRFWYGSKADAEDRLGSAHPTVKPVALMRWLCRLVTPPGGLILDPFAGTGTTGLAALGEGFDAILIEREATYFADIERRLAWARGEGRSTAQEIATRRPQAPLEGLFARLDGDAA